MFVGLRGAPLARFYGVTPFDRFYGQITASSSDFATKLSCQILRRGALNTSITAYSSDLVTYSRSLWSDLPTRIRSDFATSCYEYQLHSSLLRYRVRFWSDGTTSFVLDFRHRIRTPVCGVFVRVHDEALRVSFQDMPVRMPVFRPSRQVSRRISLSDVDAGFWRQISTPDLAGFSAPSPVARHVPQFVRLISRRVCGVVPYWQIL